MGSQQDRGLKKPGSNRELTNPIRQLDWRLDMAQSVADLMWKMLEKAGVERCYGIIGDALNCR